MHQPESTGKVQTMRCFYVTISLCLAFIPYPSIAERKLQNASELPRVLYLNSYHPGYSWSDSLARGIFKTMEGKATVYTEYLDAKRSDYEHYESNLREIIALKYSDTPVEAVLTSDDAAFRFVTENRETLFTNLPVVACGINYMTPEILAKCPNATGVAEGGNPLETAQMALKLFPKTKQIVLVSDYVAADRVAEHAKNLMKVLGSKVDFLQIRQKPNTALASIKDHLKAVEKPSVVLFFGLFFENMRSDEEAYMMQQLVDIGLPIFVFDRRYVQYGALGGIVQDGDEQGATAAQMVLQILGGTPVQQVPPVYEAIDKRIFNYAQLKHFGLIRNPLLENAAIIGMPDSRIRRYRIYLIAGSLFIVLQMVLIGGLIRAKRFRCRCAKELTNAIEKAESASQAKSEFLMLVSHELRTPLTAIDGFSELLGDEQDKSVRMEYIEHIKDSSSYLLNIINDILDFMSAKHGPQELATEACDIEGHLATLVSSYIPAAQEKNLHLEFLPLCPDSPHPHLNWEYLKLAVSKLIDNAIKFSDRGNIRVILSEEEEADTHNIAISVIDQGPGIDEKEFDKLLDVFSQAASFITREHVGMGLGLALCHRMTTAMGGTLHCRSIPNEETELKILLPFS